MSRLRLTAAGLLAAAVAVPSAAQAVPPGGPDTNTRGAKVTLSTTSVKAGKTIRVRGTKMPQKKGSVTVKLDDSAILAVFKISKNGTFSGSIQVPRSVRKGKHWFRFLAPNPATSIKKSFRVR